MVLGGEQIIYKKCNFLTDFLKLIKFGVILRSNELHEILDFFLSAGIPFKGRMKYVRVYLISYYIACMVQLLPDISA